MTFSYRKSGSRRWRKMTLDALEAGKDVYVEKPMTYSFDEAVRVRDAARDAARVTQVGYQRRTLAHSDKAREIVQSGILGDITQIQLWSSRNRTGPITGWPSNSRPTIMISRAWCGGLR